ncbi:hypothetical protein [Burkholderia lata]|uniref:hypothetical protein n=1 Tax=Burkholderia lata (strain ATCC 17760 / DSM 23089 / LMG 22485 / NCIMB 9086 / R18194 / 383) TaxID=482957 RepID=UPI001583F247|nr:hypothetical protein [Burkholderia lata]
MAGSSGSPVFDDRWRLVALHRGSTFVKNVRFQGRATAFLNVGTKWSEIAADLERREPDLAKEIRAECSARPKRRLPTAT